MTEKEFFEKNLVLTTEFDRYLLEHPIVRVCLSAVGEFL